MSKEDLDRMNETMRAYREGRHQPTGAHSAPDLKEQSSPVLPGITEVQLDLL
jgi:hypothetical protein